MLSIFLHSENNAFDQNSIIVNEVANSNMCYDIYLNLDHLDNAHKTLISIWFYSVCFKSPLQVLKRAKVSKYYV